MKFEIVGYSHYGREIIDEADTRKEAVYLANEYRTAFGAGWTITIKGASK